MKNAFRPTARLFALLVSLAMVGLSIACGGGGSSTPPMTTTAGAQSTTFNIGDDPLNGVLAFEVTINNITLTGSHGTVSVLTDPRKVELSHLAGTFEPLTLTKIPADSYSQISVTFGAAELLFLPAGITTPMHVDIPPLSAPVNVTLNPPVTVPQGISSLNFDLNLANSLSVDAANNVTFTPVFTLTNSTVKVGDEDEENGELEDIKGMLSSVNGSQFTITLGASAQTMTFNTDTTTVFDPSGTVLANIPMGTVLEVDGITQADGTFLAKKVEIETEDKIGGEAEGLVTQITGTPATSFQLVTRESTGAAGMAPDLGTTVTVTLSSNTRFRADSDDLDLGGMSFTFQSAADLAPGQNVEADADTGNATSFTATRVQLKQQALDGTISGLSGSEFQLTLDPNSTFAKLAGVTSVNVLMGNAENKTGANLANGQQVRVRGLLFFTVASGTTPATYNFVAKRVQTQ
ncbi:MAG TPA: DUF5666 domain-containing protein [Terriglobales bacterium]|nr:DUF5666 domain-containing protein [Terriglobales bacterium]